MGILRMISPSLGALQGLCFLKGKAAQGGCGYYAQTAWERTFRRSRIGNTIAFVNETSVEKAIVEFTDED